ncbi:hypothetical protein [Tenuibacillus multivorans]|uniref:Uncharacterized protein n=1 Tax=Tenuibacillus multivorans TaxID=237069 RepID=A0A1G9ZXX3_9BACI|nr:hypothetical protein [Tenuibacillus multivorans]GEL76887.1 hypothetical protein TMU01_11220 [Tenuibacillus multivorans]SDN25944.1 hypothetical protein SAMN05216498_1879 [Tenuibacillus multivorans]
MWQFIIFLIGFGFTCVGGVSIIGYLNFIPVGMGLFDFLIFIYKRPECYLLPSGLLLMFLAMYKSPFDS